jgi:DNA-directed RNA polymerase alpha subunit
MAPHQSTIEENGTSLRVTTADEARIAIQTLHGYIESLNTQARNATIAAMAIDELELNTRARNTVVVTGKIETVAQLLERTEKDLYNIDGMGKGSVDNIKETLAKHGFGLRTH